MLDDHWLHEKKILTVTIDQFPELLFFKNCSVIGYFLNQIYRPDYSFFSNWRLIPNPSFFFVINAKYHSAAAVGVGAKIYTLKVINLSIILNRHRITDLYITL